MTPEELRARPDLSVLNLQEALRMNAEPKFSLAQPEIVDAGPMLFVGINRRYEYDAMGGIPGQWRDFNRHIGFIPNEKPGAAYGVCANADSDGMDYMCAVEVDHFGLVDRNMTRLRVPAQRYLVFAHPGHISEIQGVFRAIHGEWLPESGHVMADAPSFEKYGPAFDPATGAGGYEIWTPVRS